MPRVSCLLTVRGAGKVAASKSSRACVPVQGLRHESNAAQFIVDACARQPGEVHILALGPLTNIAMAAKLDAQLGQKLVTAWTCICIMNSAANIASRGLPASTAKS